MSDHTFRDGVLAGGLISAPAWGPWLEGVNQLLTTVTLVLGIVLVAVRLWTFWRGRGRGRGRRRP